MVDVAEHRRRLAAKRKAQRHAVKREVPPPALSAMRRSHWLTPVGLGPGGRWTRLYCSNACKQAAWRDRHGE